MTLIPCLVFLIPHIRMSSSSILFVCEITLNLLYQLTVFIKLVLRDLQLFEI